MKWVSLDINNFLGLTSKLTVDYLLGLLLITVCSIAVYLDNEMRNNKIFIFILIILGLFIIGLGVFTEENARISTSYYPPGEVKKIISDGRVDISTPYPLISYRSWPGIHLISVFIIYLTNIDLAVIIKYMTLPWLVFFVFIVFSMGKGFGFSPNKCFLLSFLAISSFWTSHHYYSPQSFALLIYLFIMFFTVTISDNMIKKSVSSIMFFFLVMTHLLTTVSTLLSLFLTLIYKKYKHVKINKEFILFTVIFIAWHIYLGSTVIQWGVPDTVNRIVSMETTSVAGSKLHPSSTAELLSKAFQFTFILIYSIPVLIFIYDYRNKDYRQKMILNSILCWILGLAFITVTAYGTEVFERLYLFSSVPLACFMIISLKDYKHSDKIFVCTMVIFVIMIIPAHYGNEARSITYTTELKGSEFLSKIVQPQAPYYESYTYPFSFYLWYYKPDIMYAEHHTLNSPNDPLLNYTTYIIDSRQEDIVLKFNYMSNPIREWVAKEENGKLDLLYNNGDFNIYKNVKI